MRLPIEDLKESANQSQVPGKGHLVANDGQYGDYLWD